MDGLRPPGDHGGPEQRAALEVQRLTQFLLAPDPPGPGGVRPAGQVDVLEGLCPGVRLLRDPPDPGDPFVVLAGPQPKGVVLAHRTGQAGTEQFPVHGPRQPFVDQYVELTAPWCPCFDRPDVALVAG
ncbi:hypothetical protein GCM10027028_55030 [Streptomyces sundarbansensis]